MRIWVNIILSIWGNSRYRAIYDLLAYPAAFGVNILYRAIYDLWGNI